jgi:hypothetical protein
MGVVTRQLKTAVSRYNALKQSLVEPIKITFMKIYFYTWLFFIDLYRQLTVGSVIVQNVVHSSPQTHAHVVRDSLSAAAMWIHLRKLCFTNWMTVGEPVTLWSV